MGYKNAIALMWGEPKQRGEANQMIDLLLWEYSKWEENEEISIIALRNGSIITPRLDGSLPVTCGGGEDILHAEKEYRHSGITPVQFKLTGPKIPELAIPGGYDFCYPEGRRRLAEVLKKDNHFISD